MLGVVSRIGILVHGTANHRLRLIRLSPYDSVQRLLATDPRIAAKEIDRAGAKSKQLRNPRIVVLGLGKMAVRAIFRRARSAGRVRKVRIKRLPAVSVAAHGLLLRIEPVPVLVLRTDDHRTRRTDHRQPVLLHRAINAKHEHIVPDDLRVISREIAVKSALKLVQRHTLVGLHRKMAAETARRPRGMADLAIHAPVIMRERCLALRARQRHVAPSLAVALDGLRMGGLRIIAL